MSTPEVPKAQAEKPSVKVMLQELTIELSKKENEQKNSASIISDYLQVKQATKENREELKKQVLHTPGMSDRMKQGVIEMVQKDPAEMREKMTVTDKVVEKLDVRNWSPEAKAVGMIALGAGAIYLAVKWLGKKTKNAAVAAAETTKKGASFLWTAIKWTVGLAVVGGVSYFGFKMYQQYSEVKKMGDEVGKRADKLKEEATATIKKGRELLDEQTKKAAEELRILQEKAKNAVSDADKEALQKKVVELEERVKQEKAKLEEATKQAELKMAQGLQALKEGATDTGKKVSPETKEASKNAAKSVSLGLVGMGLLLLNKEQAENAKCTEKADGQALQTILKFPKVHALTVGELTGAADDANARAALTKQCDLQGENMEHALHFLCLVAKNKQTTLVQAMKKAHPEKNDSELKKEMLATRLDDLLEGDGIGSRYATRVMEQMESHKGKSLAEMPDIKTIIHNTFSNHDWAAEIIESPGFTAKLDALSTEAGVKIDVADPQMRARFALFCSSHMPNQVSALQKMALTPEEEKFAKILSVIEKKVQGHSDYIAQYAQGHVRPKTAGVGGERTDDVLLKALKNLNVQNALQLYAYVGMALPKDNKETPSLKDSHALGAMMLQMKALHIVSEQDTMQGITFRNELGAKVLKAIAGDTTAINLPPQTIEMLQKIVGKSANVAGNMFIDTIKRISMEGAALLEQAGIHADVGSPAVVAGFGTYYGSKSVLGWLHPVRWRTNSIMRQASAMELSSSKTYQSISKPLVVDRMKNFFKHLIPGVGEVREWQMGNVIKKEIFEKIASGAHSAEEVIKAFDAARQSPTSAVQAMYKAKIPMHEIGEGMAKFKQGGGNTLVQALYEAGATPQEMQQALDSFGKAGGKAQKINVPTAAKAPSSAVNKITRVGGAGLGAWATYESGKEFMEARNYEAMIHEVLEPRLMGDGFVKVAEDTYERKYGDLPVRVSLKPLKELAKDRQYAAATDTAANAIGTVSAIALSSNPIGWAIAAGIISVNIINSASSRAADLNIIRTMPPWLLAWMGTQGTMAKGEMEFLGKSWGDTWLNFQTGDSGIENDRRKLDVENRMLFSLFCQNVRTDPVLASSMGHILVSPTALDQMFQNDFQSLILPSIHLTCLSVMNAEGADKLKLRPDYSKISAEQVQEATLRVAALYRMHLAEKAYLQARATLAKDPTNEQAKQIQKDLDGMVMFGSTLKDAFPELLKNTGDKESPRQFTRAEIMLANMQKKLMHSAPYPGATIALRRDSYTIPKLQTEKDMGRYDLHGVQGDVSFSNDWRDASADWHIDTSVQSPDKPIDIARLTNRKHIRARLNKEGNVVLSDAKGYQWMRLSDTGLQDEKALQSAGHISANDKLSITGKGIYALWKPGAVPMVKELTTSRFGTQWRTTPPDCILAVEGNDDHGQSIDKAIFVSEQDTYHTPIDAKQKEIFLQLPGAGYSWQYLNKYGVPQGEEYGVNTTVDHLGKCAVTQPEGEKVSHIRFVKDSTVFTQEVRWPS